MARIEKTVFISYRRADVYTALAVYENLKNQGYDVFFDYRSISSGDFEQIITINIRARAHFILILSPTALDRCNEPDDWLRREIELAIDEQRNIVPLFFKGFRFGLPSVIDKLTGKLRYLSRYNGLNVHEDYFEEAMHRLRAQFLDIPLNTVLHPVSTEVQRVVRAEQSAADKALEQIENVLDLVKRRENKTDQSEIESEQTRDKKTITPLPALHQNKKRIPKLRIASTGGVLTMMLLCSLVLWMIGVPFDLFDLINVFESPRPPASPIATMLSDKDGMTLVYVSAGVFTMGSNDAADTMPAHTVFLDDFWIDKTEVTNAMYAKCVQSTNCNEPSSKGSRKRDSYYGNPEFDNYPVVYVTWDHANDYCLWANRRLPTEAEWEKAARGTDARTYPWGNQLPENYLLNYLESDKGDTTEVGTYPNGASPYGALDMAGNVYEWVNDWFSLAYYATSPTSNPPGPEAGQQRILRSGSWGDSYYGVISSLRREEEPNHTDDYYGIRCAMDATP